MPDGKRADILALFSATAIEEGVSAVAAHAHALAAALVDIRRNGLPKRKREAAPKSLVERLSDPHVIDPVVSELLALSLLEKAVAQLHEKHTKALEKRP